MVVHFIPLKSMGYKFYACTAKIYLQKCLLICKLIGKYAWSEALVLGDWLKREGKTASWLARMLDVSHTAVGSWVRRETAMRLDTALKIRDLTDGAVTVDDLAPVEGAACEHE